MGPFRWILQYFRTEPTLKASKDGEEEVRNRSLSHTDQNLLVGFPWDLWVASAVLSHWPRPFRTGTVEHRLMVRLATIPLQGKVHPSAVPLELGFGVSAQSISRVHSSMVVDTCEVASHALRCSLMEHQRQGLAWMNELEKSARRGGILADDMGLGKTVQALSLIVVRPGSIMERHATLIIAPAGLVQQWKESIKQLLNPGSYQLRVYVHHGSKRPVSFAHLHDHDIVITTYGTVAAEWQRKQSLDHASFSGSEPILGPSSRWHRVVLDEAQNIKNDRSNAAMGCCAIDATYRWCLSATPLMNHQRELYSLLKFLRVAEYTGVDGTAFQSAFNSGYEYERRGAAEQLQSVLQTILLRRTKSSVIGGRPIVQLPSRTTEKVYVDLNEEERRLYTALEGSVHAQLDHYPNGEARRHSVTHMISLLQRLQRACCHPFLVTDDSRPLGKHILTEEQLMGNARQLPEAVILRLRVAEDLLDCPICFDVVEDPMIFFPCGHSACVDCFGRISSAREVRCHSCRAVIDPARATNYVSFARSNALLLEDSVSATESPVPEVVAGMAEYPKAGSQRGGGSNSTRESDPSAFQSGVHTQQWRTAFRPNEGESTQRLSLLRKQSSRSSAARRSYRQALENAWITSSKIDKALEIVEQIQNDGTGDKIIIFSQFTSLLDLVEIPLRRRGWLFGRYDGSMRLADRHAVVVEFSTNPNCRLMLVSLRAGNAGLNLTAASKVIILDPFWNPFVEEQAIGRVHRIGQQRPVHVFRILIPDTVEDRIQNLQDEKRRLVQGTLSDAADSAVRLGRQNLTYLLVGPTSFARKPV
ncbi:hypothetical protein Asppvi_003819 [Aspergillus pseudoviridinutans]|uniref:SNF2 family N-terminal domain-containing protein n=1 Tax=Aspergillus pseudoviridinutans TaxID=1517512 RepID=A0A9P3B7R1_9EURO|nr:uncharacterized protein Asppvi_003819 [Aspergillus pseudoviridinutans]GIJ84964.1 hypothetical protein Asppvi_003819 [Aspergillus pseudoviridinutans]